MSELLEEILSGYNMNAAYITVWSNKGAGGVDAVTGEEHRDYIKEDWNSIIVRIRDSKARIRDGKYKSHPVREVEVPQPNGGVRSLGILTAMGRII